MELHSHTQPMTNGKHTLHLDASDCHVSISTYRYTDEGNAVNITVFDVTKRHLLELIRQLTEAADAIKEE